MTEADLRLQKKMAAAAAWRGKIENQGIMYFGVADKLNCATNIALGLGDATFAFICSVNSSSVRIIDTSTSTGTSNEFVIYIDFSSPSSSSFKLLSRADSTTFTSSTFSVNLGDMILGFVSLDRDGDMTAYVYNLTDPNSLWGYAGSVSISSISTTNVNESGTVAVHAAANIAQTSWILPLVNRAMTADETQTLVECVMAPDSWPSDLQGVGDLSTNTLGQIFDIRPTRSGTHADGTGNGYNWTNSGSPIIKPFSAGIQ